jgi:hypothetical protein
MPQISSTLKVMTDQLYHASPAVKGRLLSKRDYMKSETQNTTESLTSSQV